MVFLRSALMCLTGRHGVLFRSVCPCYPHPWDSFSYTFFFPSVPLYFHITRHTLPLHDLKHTVICVLLDFHTKLVTFPSKLSSRLASPVTFIHVISGVCSTFFPISFQYYFNISHGFDLERVGLRLFFTTTEYTLVLYGYSHMGAFLGLNCYVLLSLYSTATLLSRHFPWCFSILQRPEEIPRICSVSSKSFIIFERVIEIFHKLIKLHFLFLS